MAPDSTREARQREDSGVPFPNWALAPQASPVLLPEAPPRQGDIQETEKQQKETGHHAGAAGSGRGTWKQEGHMVMEASGRRERKYCHCRGGGQRLMRTSRRLMERSTDRLTTTGTNSEPPCCRAGGQEAGSTVPSHSHSDMFT